MQWHSGERPQENAVHCFLANSILIHRLPHTSANWTANCEVRGFKSGRGQKFGSRFLFLLRPLASSTVMSTLTAHCQWEDETVRERTGYPPSYAEAEKMESLTLHTHGCPRASLKD